MSKVIGFAIDDKALKVLNEIAEEKDGGKLSVTLRRACTALIHQYEGQKRKKEATK